MECIYKKDDVILCIKGLTTSCNGKRIVLFKKGKKYKVNKIMLGYPQITTRKKSGCGMVLSGNYQSNFILDTSC